MYICKKLKIPDHLAKSATTTGLVEPHCAVTPVSIRFNVATNMMINILNKQIGYQDGDDDDSDNDDDDGCDNDESGQWIT